MKSDDIEREALRQIMDAEVDEADTMLKCPTCGKAHTRAEYTEVTKDGYRGQPIRRQ